MIRTNEKTIIIRDIKRRSNTHTSPVEIANKPNEINKLAIALLELVNKIKLIEPKKIDDIIPFLKVLSFVAKKHAMQNGTIIFNQHPV